MQPAPEGANKHWMGIIAEMRLPSFHFLEDFDIRNVMFPDGGKRSLMHCGVL